VSPVGFAGTNVVLNELDVDEPDPFVAVTVSEYVLPAVKPVIVAVLFTTLVVIDGVIDGVKLYV